MTYFKIDGTDYSNIVKSMSVNQKANYSSQTNAAGNTVVDYINRKREVEVGFIPLKEEDMAVLQNEFSKFNVTISFRNPLTNALEENVNCIIPSNKVEYYTIQIDNVSYKTFKVKFTEL